MAGDEEPGQQLARNSRLAWPPHPLFWVSIAAALIGVLAAVLVDDGQVAGSTTAFRALFGFGVFLGTYAVVLIPLWASHGLPPRLGLPGGPQIGPPEQQQQQQALEQAVTGSEAMKERAKSEERSSERLERHLRKTTELLQRVTDERDRLARDNERLRDENARLRQGGAGGNGEEEIRARKANPER